MPLLVPRAFYRPFEYEWAYEGYLKQNQAHWLATEVPMSADVADYRAKLTDAERNLINQVLRFFVQGDIAVANNYQTRLMPIFPAPEVAMMLSSFANAEAIHVHAYSYLIDTLGLPESEYAAFMAYDTMRRKYEYLHGFNNTTPQELAKTLAVFGAFMEGTALFASFAILMNFPRQGKLKGLGQIITWSVRDESCVADGTEILTQRGWVDFRELKDTDKVAQYDLETSEVSFVVPQRIIRKKHKGKVRHFRHTRGGIEQVLTLDHDMVQRWAYQKSWSKQKAGDFNPNPKKVVPVSGYARTGKKDLTDEERFKIAFQADGNVNDRYTGEIVGTVPAFFSFAKERKITRMRNLLGRLNWTYKESAYTNASGTPSVKFTVNVPVSVKLSKYFKDWVLLDEVSSSWADEFIEELSHWDGHVPSDPSNGYYTYYSSIVKDNVDVVQALSSLCGRHSSQSVQHDDRKESYSSIYRTWIHEMDVVRTGSLQSELVDYDGEVHCVTVPTGAFVMRYNGRVSITGNCHADYICRLYRQFIAENPQVNTQAFREEIVKACVHMVEMEDAFIDTCFEMGAVRGLSPQDVKQYIRWTADNRLADLGLPPQFKVESNPLPWLAAMLSAKEHSNFFEARATDYAKANVDDSWPA